MPRKPPVQLVLPSALPAATGDAASASRHGGRRPGAGRPRKAGCRNVPHAPRPPHAGRCPVHVTMRAKRGLPSLRSELVRNQILRQLHRNLERGTSFRVVHFSIQKDHVHLLVEAGVKGTTGTRDVSGKDAQGLLRSGVQGLAAWLARRVNRVLGRRGKFWADRHHRRDLESPTAVRHALAYVLSNHVHHGLAPAGIVDAFSSLPTSDVLVAEPLWDPLPPDRFFPLPRSWLLSVGWRRVGGPLRLAEPPVS